MERNLLNELKNIKKLMYLNETNEDCEKQLEDAGYVVYNPDELKKTGMDCQDKPLLKCAKVLLDEKGIKYEINKFNNKCYLIIKVGGERILTLDGKSKKFFKENITLWEDNTISYIATLSYPHNITSGPYINKNIVQFMYEGDFKCGNSGIFYDNLEYKGLFDFNDFNNIIPTQIDIKKIGPQGNPVSLGLTTDKFILKTAGDVFDLIK